MKNHGLITGSIGILVVVVALVLTLSALSHEVSAGDLEPGETKKYTGEQWTFVDLSSGIYEFEIVGEMGEDGDTSGAGCDGGDGGQGIKITGTKEFEYPTTVDIVIIEGESGDRSSAANGGDGGSMAAVALGADELLAEATGGGGGGGGGGSVYGGDKGGSGAYANAEEAEGGEGGTPGSFGLCEDGDPGDDANYKVNEDEFPSYDDTSGSYEEAYVEITYVSADLDISHDGQGSTDPSEGTYTYDYEEIVTLEADPDDGWEFDEWTGDIDKCAGEAESCFGMDEDDCEDQKGCTWSSTFNTCLGLSYYCRYLDESECGDQIGCEWQDLEDEEIEVVMYEHKDVTANFEIIEHRVEVRRSFRAEDGSSGQARFEYGSYSNLPISRTYEHGENVRVEADPDEDSEFDYWNTDPCDGNSDPVCEFTVEDDETLYAVWEVKKHEVTAEAGDDGGSVSPESQWIEHGDDATVTADPDDGYVCGYWDGEASGSGCDHTFHDVTEDKYAIHNFYELGVDVDAPGDDEVDEPGMYMYTFEVENKGDVDDTYDLSLDEEQGWLSDGVSSDIDVDAGDTEYLEIELDIPPEDEGETSEIELTAVSQKDGTVEDSDSFEVEANFYYDVEVEAPEDQDIYKVGYHTFDFEVINEGTTEDTYTISYSIDFGSKGWEVETDDSDVTLGPGESQDIEVEVYMPQGTGGEETWIQMTAQSQTLDYVEDSDSFTILFDDYQDPDINIYYYTTVDGSEYVTRNRDVTFIAEAVDDKSGVWEMVLDVEMGDDSFSETCEFSYEYPDGGPTEQASCSLMVEDENVEELDQAYFDASIEDGAGNVNTDDLEFTVCGFYENTAEIGNEISPDTTCGDGTRIRGEYCQDNQKAGLTIEGAGMCPPLFFQVNASSTVGINENEIDKYLLHPEAETSPVLKECNVKYDVIDDNEMKGIHGEGIGDGETPPKRKVMNEIWDVGIIPYYCRGEVIEAENYGIYEHENLDDSEIYSKYSGELVSHGDASGEIVLDPTIKKMEFGIIPEENVKTGLWENVFPMNTTNWNAVPIAAKFSWEEGHTLDLFEEWSHYFTRSFEFNGEFIGGKSYDDIEDYGYARTPDNDLQLVLLGRGEDERFEDFALVVNAPPWFDYGPYATKVVMTTDENELEWS